MTLIAHLSDLHFGTEIPEVVTSLRTSIRSLAPALVIISGDITQRARSQQFQAAREFADSLGLPWIAIPGNHDIPLFNVAARFLAPYHGYTKYFGERNYVHILNGIAFIALDATTPYLHTDGRLDLGTTQQRLRQTRQEIGDAATLVAMVHQPLLTAWEEDHPEELINSQKVAEIFSEARVDMIMSGHVHVPLVCTTAKKYPGLPYSFVHSGAGTAISHRTRASKPNSFNLLNLGADRINVQIHEYKKSDFISAESHSFLKGANGWEIVP